MTTPCEEKKKWLESGKMGWRESQLTSTQRALQVEDNSRPKRESLIQRINRGNYGRAK